MGSYAGSSDWDELPSSGDAARFTPARTAPAEKPDEDSLELEQSGKGGKLDLILAFDTTGSMRPWIHNVREKVDYLARGLFRLMDIRIALIGIGDHCDGELMLQCFPLTASLDDMQRAVHDVRGTSGGDYPEAFECFFKHLNENAMWDWRADRAAVMVLITDAIPHGMGGAGDAGCPDNVDARAELAKLMRRLRSFYLVNCGNHAESIKVQRTLVKSENYFMQLDNFRRLTNLVMALCMDEVGELDYFMGILEKQRGKERRDEVLALMRR